jgi:hypothetical protein
LVADALKWIYLCYKFEIFRVKPDKVSTSIGKNML